MDSIGEEIKAARKAAGITQFQLCEKADVGIVTLYNIEAHKHTDSIDTLERIADVLGKKFVLVDKETR